MTIKRVSGFIAILTGLACWFVGAIGVFATFYYRPTLEFVEVEGRSVSTPSWLTGEFVGFVFGAFLAVVGGSLLLLGNRWRRQ